MIKWKEIKSPEDLPPKCEEVLIYIVLEQAPFCNQRITASINEHGNWEDHNGLQIRGYQVTHWAPLLEAPV